MKKIDFTKIQAEAIDGTKMDFDARMMLGNLLYMQGADITECELGRKIYNAPDSPIDIDDKEEQTIRRMAMALPYVYRQAIMESLK